MKITLHLAVIGFALLMSFSRPAWSACTGMSLSTSITAEDLKNMKPPRDAALGSPLLVKFIDEGIASLSCNTNGEWFVYGFLAGEKPVPGYDNVFETGIPGIGMRVYWTHEGGVFMKSPGPRRQLKNWQYSPPQKFMFELIKIGTVQSGVTSVHRVEVRYGALLSNLIDFSNVAYEANIIGCKVVSEKSPQIDLPLINNRHLGHRGATAGAKGFSIDLECDKGVRVGYQIDADGTPEHVIKNAQGDGMARGVGVQLVQGDVGSNVVQPLSARTGFTTSATTVDGEQISIPLAARYYQTDDALEAGKVSATATVTLFYH
ncbi:fimbrial protein [Achromobacter kerstersii]